MNTSDLIRSGVQQAAAGKELDSNTLDSTQIGDISQAASPEDEEYRAENSTVDDLLPDGDSNPEDSSEAEKEPASSEAPAKKTSNKETITVSDDKGRKRTIEIDYSNKEAIKKAHLEAAGMRKFQVERDRALQTFKQTQAQLEERNKDWNTLEQAFQQGPQALFDLLAGQKGAFDQHVQKTLQKKAFLENATPEEIEAYKEREQAQLDRKELDRIRKENEEFKQSVLKEREEAETKALESRVHPVFSKYRFADRLGDANDEQMFDEMLWNSAMKRLEPYEEQGLDISPELVEREFRAVAQSIRKRINVQAEKKATKVIDDKKREATENVQNKVKSGYKSDSVSNEARDLINNNNLTGLLKGWNKYGTLFRK
jgi:hypothetical protein